MNVNFRLYQLRKTVSLVLQVPRPLGVSHRRQAEPVRRSERERAETGRGNGEDVGGGATLQNCEIALVHMAQLERLGIPAWGYPRGYPKSLAKSPVSVRK